MSSGRAPRGLSDRVFRLAASAFPKSFGREHADEMTAAFEAELDSIRVERGRLAGAWYAVRAILDAVLQGARERVRRGPLPGHGSRRPPGGVGSGLGADVRVALRALTRSPGFTLAPVAVLALGIGANATVFSALRVVILTPPPYPEPDRLALVHLTQEHRGRGDVRTTSWSYPKFEHFLEADRRLIDPVAAYSNRVGILTEAGPATRLDFEVVSPSYFSILGVTASLGRTFVQDEDDPSEPPLLAVLSHELWSSRFGGDSAAVARDITLNGVRLRVVGVAPDGFVGLTGTAQLWVPIAAADQALGYSVIEQSGNHWFHVVGRLRPDATLEEARAQVASIGAGIAEAYPSNDPQAVWSATARAFEEARVNEDAHAAIVLLTVAAALILLVACANLSGLLLARARRRAKDGAVRVAVGASRWRIVRASLVESALLAGIGGVVGIGLAAWGTGAMASAWPSEFLRSTGGEMRVSDLSHLGLEPTVLLFAALTTLLTALLVGGAPAAKASGADVSSTLKHGTGATRRERTWLGIEGRAALVGAQIAMALVLVVGAGLVGSSTARLLDVDLGFRHEGLLSFRYAVPETSAWSDRPGQFHDELLARIAELPSVEAAGTGSQPLRQHWFQTRVDAVEGGAEIPRGEGVLIGGHMVSDAYFRTLGVPVLGGRTFDARDGTDRFPTIVISESTAAELFPGRDPIGRRIRIGISDEGKESWSEIVGVVGDVRYAPPDQPSMPETYYSHREFGTSTSTVLVRTTEEPTRVMPAIRALASELDPTLAVYGVTTGEEIVRSSVSDRRVLLILIGLFAAVAVLLAATGTWGIVAASVAERRRELGLRLALGAGDGRVLRLVLRQSAVTALLGVTAGLAAAAAGSGLLDAFLWETTRLAPSVYLGGAVLLTAVVLLASWLPARAILRLDPADTLRSE